MDKNYAIRYLDKIRHVHLSSRNVFQRVDFDVHDKNIDGKSRTSILSRNRISIDLALPSAFFDFDDSVIPEYDFVETVISFHHELYHAMQCFQIKAIPDTKDELPSLVSRYYNNETYAKEYHKFSYEIAAERYALHKTYDELKANLPNLNTEDIIIDYVNARIGSSGEYKYFISSDTGFTNINDIFKAFDKAYVKSYITKKDFTSHKTDCVGEVLNKNPALRSGFNEAKDGKEQTQFAVSIVLDKHPELYKQYPSLKHCDYDIQNIINKNFSDYLDDMIDDDEDDFSR